jgi:hypothetical protein
LLEYPFLAKRVPTGIDTEPDVPGYVTEFEERTVAADMALPWDRWDVLPREERVDAVAWWRMRRLLEAHREDAVSRHHERQDFMRKASKS